MQIVPLFRFVLALAVAAIGGPALAAPPVADKYLTDPLPDTDWLDPSRLSTGHDLAAVIKASKAKAPKAGARMAFAFAPQVAFDLQYSSTTELATLQLRGEVVDYVPSFLPFDRKTGRGASFVGTNAYGAKAQVAARWMHSTGVRLSWPDRCRQYKSHAFTVDRDRAPIELFEAKIVVVGRLADPYVEEIETFDRATVANPVETKVKTTAVVLEVEDVLVIAMQGGRHKVLMHEVVDRVPLDPMTITRATPRKTCTKPAAA